MPCCTFIHLTTRISPQVDWCHETSQFSRLQAATGNLEDFPQSMCEVREPLSDLVPIGNGSFDRFEADDGIIRPVSIH